MLIYNSQIYSIILSSIRPSTSEESTSNQRITMIVIPAVLLNALREYNFVSSPLWRMTDGKDLVPVELTFHKNLPTTRFYKKGVESKRQPAPSAGEWPRQPTAATRPTTTTRSTPARRQPTPEETSPPAVQTLQTTAPTTIRHQRKPQTVEITPSPIIMRPTTPPPSPDSPPTKKPIIKSPKYTRRQPTQYFHVKNIPLHEKNDLQDVHVITYKVIVEATRQPREEEINIDLPAFFVYHRENKHWIFIKGPTSMV